MYAHELRKWSLANLLLMFLLLPALALAVTMSAGDIRSLSTNQSESIPIESIHNPGHDRSVEPDHFPLSAIAHHTVRHHHPARSRRQTKRYATDQRRSYQQQQYHGPARRIDVAGSQRHIDSSFDPFAPLAGNARDNQHVTRHHHHQNYHHVLQQQPQPTIEHQPQSQSAPSAMTMRQPSGYVGVQSAVPSTTHRILPTTPSASSIVTATSATHNAYISQKSASSAFLPQHQPLSQSQQQRRRFCSARDPKTLAFEAPTVFEGKVKSMSADRRHNFSVTFEVLRLYKEQPQLKLPSLVRLQFEQRNTSGECDIYREQLRPRGYVRELEPGKVYLLFVEQQQGDIGNFSILGQPVKKTRKAVMDVRQGVDDRYDFMSRPLNASDVSGQRAFIESLLVNHSTAREGRRVRIVCKVRGQPPPKVTWFKDGRSISRNRTKYQFVYLRKRSELIIRSAMRSDTGKYECRAKNKLARQTVSRVTWVDIASKENPEVIRVTPNTSIGAPCPHVGDAFCLNGGTCVFFKDVGEPACKCPDGFMGQRCETKNPTNRQSSTYNKKEQQQCGDNKFYGSYYC